jgi:hypothetical protein
MTDANGLPAALAAPARTCSGYGSRSERIVSRGRPGCVAGSQRIARSGGAGVALGLGSSVAVTDGGRETSHEMGGCVDGR